MLVPFGGMAPVYAGVGAAPTNEWEISVAGQAGDPLVSAAADIDYEGAFRISVASFSPPRVTVSLDATIDAFPAFEAYARLDGLTKTLFTAPPPAGNTVLDLLGGASRKFSGFATLP
ncbi:hypothetical protein [Methylosinus sporium]|uniref:hypothetical protein n=1 Tax=Methylosinus sporium TaxID=428 RepID=UPI00383A6318